MKELYIGYGSSISRFYEKAVEKAKQTNETYWFVGNGIKFIASPDSDPKLVDKYLDDCYKYDIKVLGPEAPEISPEYKALKDKERQEAAERTAKLHMQEKEAFEQVKEQVKDVTLNFLDNCGYNRWKKKNSSSLYSSTCFEYAEYLAKLLELVLQKKQNYDKKDVLNCEKELNYLGITGFQHGCVISILSKYWNKYNQKIFNII